MCVKQKVALTALNTMSDQPLLEEQKQTIHIFKSHIYCSFVDFTYLHNSDQLPVFYPGATVVVSVMSR